jgi:hypothetical protein
MSVRDVIRAVLRGEVDRIDHGTDHIASMRERETERRREEMRLRGQANQTHPDLRSALERRQRDMK